MDLDLLSWDLSFKTFFTPGSFFPLAGWAIITLFIPGLAIFLRAHIDKKRKDRLEKTTQHYQLRETKAYQRAVNMMPEGSESQYPEDPVSHYYVSLLILTIIIGANAYLLIFGGDLKRELINPNFILAAGAPDGIKDFTAYQFKTLMVITVAFIGAYIWSIQMTFRRILTLDLSPQTFQGLSVRILVATMVAVIIRHVFPGEDGEISNSVLVLLGFACGIFPQMAIGYLKEAAKKLLGGKIQEAQALPLIMIEGISVFDRVRLGELGIEDAQNLAHANPIEIFIRTPFRLELVMDWVAQAQALVFLGSKKFGALREGLLIRTIFQFYDSLLSNESRKEVADILEIHASVLESLRGTLDEKPTFVGLNQLRKKMVYEK